MSGLAGNRLVEMTAGLFARHETRIAPYLTAGDGGLDRTLELLHAVERAGAACVELGVPFSDPIADGPTLQAAAARSLDAGTTLDGIERTVRAFRDAGGALPILAFSYLNPLLSGGVAHGLARRMASLRAAGFDGLLVPDLPVEEAPGLVRTGEANGLATVCFCAPTTTDERIRLAAEVTRGFLYVVGRVGVTGRETAIQTGADDYLARVRALTTGVPLGVGFGIRTAGQVQDVAEHAELAIVGSALVAAIHDAASEAEAVGADPTEAAARRATEFIHSLTATSSGAPPVA